MPSKRRTKQDAEAMAKPRKHENPTTVDSRVAPMTGNGAANRGGARRVDLSFPLPRSTVVSGASAVTGGTGLTVAIATGNVEPIYIWPCIALTALGMAYDLGRRMIDRRKTDNGSGGTGPTSL
ncbi:hypothetical protein AB0H77_26895 [Streptomyces sp. NPDC050844]|uniref:hypothetical protein n=1 Tax=Streptomyces sp. NPDC050844 TaxID=3155790 RepID=UPI0033E846AB